MAKVKKSGLVTAVLTLLCLSLVGLPGPALAYTIFYSSIYAYLWMPEPLPPGIGVTGWAFDQPAWALVQGGTGIALESPSAYDTLIASQFSSVVNQGTLFNPTTAPVTIPVMFGATSYLSAWWIPDGYPRPPGLFESVDARWAYSLLFDGALLTGGSNACHSDSVIGTPPCGISDDWFERDLFLLTLTPGSHSVIVLAEASGFASTVLPEPVPEPTTLVLWGVTATALGFLARRRRNQASA